MYIELNNTLLQGDIDTFDQLYSSGVQWIGSKVLDASNFRFPDRNDKLSHMSKVILDMDFQMLDPYTGPRKWEWVLDHMMKTLLMSSDNHLVYWLMLYNNVLQIKLMVKLTFKLK